MYHLEPDDPDQAFLDIFGVHRDGSLEASKVQTLQHVRTPRVCARLDPKILKTNPAWLPKILKTHPDWIR